MTRYIIKDKDFQTTKKAILKWPDIQVHNNYFRGVVKITNFRKYRNYNNIDIEFQGEIFAKINPLLSEWFDKSILKKHKISKIKLNRFFRKKLLFDIKTRLKYFDVEISHYTHIKNIKWT